jgi:hypothetical protein
LGRNLLRLLWCFNGNAVLRCESKILADLNHGSQMLARRMVYQTFSHLLRLFFIFISTARKHVSPTPFSECFSSQVFSEQLSTPLSRGEYAVYFRVLHGSPAAQQSEQRAWPCTRQSASSISPWWRGFTHCAGLSR